MFTIHKDYTALSKPVLNALVAEFFIQLISTALLYILPLYMRVEGYSDVDIAAHISFRFLGILIVNVPLGFVIKGRKMKGFFMATGVAVPILTIVCIQAISYHIGWLISVTQFLHGVFYAFTSAAILPYIIRNEKPENQTEAIALHFAVWSIGAVISGWMMGFLNIISPHVFTEKNVLMLVGIIGFTNLYFLSKIKGEHVPEEKSKIKTIHKEFDWKVIAYTLIPITLISVGAGLAMPYVSLFFANVHAMKTGAFALLTSVAALLVVFATLYIPTLKRKFGMRKAITNTQIIAVTALVLLASTQYVNEYRFAVIVAVGAYCIRNPLMNMVGPLTSELVMNYVGKKNQEILSALMSALNSGGYFISAMIFKLLRGNNMSYAGIFYITAGLYFAAVFFYYQMAGRYLAREKSA